MFLFPFGMLMDQIFFLIFWQLTWLII